MRRFFNMLPLSIKKKISNNTSFFLWKEYIKSKKLLDKQIKLFNYNIKDGLPIQGDISLWTKTFEKYLKASPKRVEISTTFFESDIRLIKKIDEKLSSKDVIAIIVEKNDLLKLKEFMKYHRELGVKRFAVLDNNSEDETLSWLKKQDDVEIFSSLINYTTWRRQGWINRIVAYYGVDRWFLVLDSDELLKLRSQFSDICEYIDYLEERNIRYPRSIMLDLYAKDEFYSKNSDENYIDEMIYFDKKSYYSEIDERFIPIRGGMRKRVFDTSPLINKIPLFKIGRGEICVNSHYMYPFELNFDKKLDSIIFHYKFLPSDLSKYLERVTNKNFSGDSQDYVGYLSNLKNEIKYWHTDFSMDISIEVDQILENIESQL